MPFALEPTGRIDKAALYFLSSEVEEHSIAVVTGRELGDRRRCCASSGGLEWTAAGASYVTDGWWAQSATSSSPLVRELVVVIDDHSKCDLVL